MIYSQELKDRTFKAYEGDVNNGMVRQRELEEKVLMYYRRTTPSLQEYYSRYTPEWEAFYSSESLSDMAFLQYLKQMRGAFKKRYELTELNIDYYIMQMESCSLLKGEASQIKEFFLDKWHQLLTRKEFDYQYMHIDSLCDSFDLLTRKQGKESGNRLLGSRMEWLLHSYPELYRKMLPFEQVMKRNPSIQQLAKLLGRKNREQQKYDSLSGVDKKRLFRHSTHSDIGGVTLGNDLNSLLPIEYCYLAEDSLRAVFMERYAEKRLQLFDYQSRETDPVKDDKHKVSGQGPYIICVDTSGSMQGDREVLSKSAILAIAQLTEKTHRKCYVINFSDEAVSLMIEDLGRDMPKLAEFLNKSFDGGTDIEPALREAAHIINGNDFRESDIVLISDFEMPPLSKDLAEQVKKIKRRKTSFFGLVFGNRPEMEYLNLCERYWEM